MRFPCIRVECASLSQTAFYNSQKHAISGIVQYKFSLIFANLELPRRKKLGFYAMLDKVGIAYRRLGASFLSLPQIVAVLEVGDTASGTRLKSGW